MAEDKLAQHAQLLKRETGEFFRNNPQYREGLHDRDKAVNTCGKVSYNLKRHLENKGIKASLIRARHSTVPLDKGAYPDYYWLDPKKMFHFAVRSGKHLIDTTGAQFGKKYAGPQVMHINDFRKRWKTVGHSNEWFGS